MDCKEGILQVALLGKKATGQRECNSRRQILGALLVAGICYCPHLSMAQAPGSDAIEIEIESRQLNPPSPAGDKLFTRQEGREIGIYRPIEFSMKDHWPPFWNGRGIASGDIDRDGDDDVVLASSDRGLHVFENLGDGSFREQIPDTPFAAFPNILAALVDVDNDGWLDIFLAGYQVGNRIMWNENGTFSESRMTEVKNRDDAILTTSATFGDVDKDGDLDAVIGNWGAGWYRRVPGPEGINRLIYNDDGRLTGDNANELPGMPGETLTALLSDFNLDGALDLLVGNDFQQPDIFYLGDGKGGFRQLWPGDGIIPVTTTTTMSIKTADFDNDLVPEIYISQIAGRAEGIRDTLKLRPSDLYCSDIDFEDDRAKCQANIEIRNWYKVGGHQAPIAEASRCRDGTAEFESECKAMLIKDIALQRRDPSLCSHIPANQPRTLLLCEAAFRPSIQVTERQYSEEIPQIRGRNVLLQADGGFYRDVAQQQGLAIGGWSWDVKVADFDLDELQDVYVTNGFWGLARTTPSNMLFRNQGKGPFKDTTEEDGLVEYLILSSVTAVDFDNDGDQDLIGQAVNGPVMAYRNNAQADNRIVFQLDDGVGNRNGVGSKITIRYGIDGRKHQMREIQSGGGYLSFDAAKAFFALGSSDEVSDIDIEWSTGEKTAIEGPFKAGSVHTVKRSRE